MAVDKTAEDSGLGKVSFVAILVGIISVIIALLIGFFTYQNSFKMAEMNFHSFYLNKAQMLAVEIESYRDLSTDDLLRKVKTFWEDSGDKPSDEYMCIVDSDSRLVLHTKYPEAIGKIVGTNPVLQEDNPDINVLLDIVKLQKSCVGGFISSEGQEQIAAFAPAPQRGWTIGVHRSSEVLAEEIRSSIWFLALGFIVVCGFLLPTSLTFLYVMFRSSHRRMMKVEEQLKISHEKLINSERLAVVGKLSSGIAHEIRNPLSVISASAYYLKEKLKNADEKTQSHIKRINNQVNISNDIIQNMQNLTLMKELEKTQIDIAAAVENGINSSKIPQTVKVISKVPEGEFIVTVDVKQISIVFENILTNAIQAMDNEGTIWITAHKSGDKWVEVSFQDSGPG
ncbi:MAG: histidine kinase dimerization/phospho-acceptor domain-containing protein, partial [Candidatus Scalindua sp.]